MALRHLVNTSAGNAISVKTFELYRIHELFVAVLREKKRKKKKKFIKLLVKKLRVADARDPVHLRFPIILRGKWPRRENRRWVVFFKLRENKAIPVIAKFRTILKENRIVLFVCRVGGKIEIADWEDLAKFHTISVDENFGEQRREIVKEEKLIKWLISMEILEYKSMW